MKKPKGFYALVVAVILITVFVFCAAAYIPIISVPEFTPFALSTTFLQQSGTVLNTPVLWLLLLFIPYGVLFDILWDRRKAGALHGFLTAFFLLLIYHVVSRYFHSDWGYSIDVPIGAGLGAVTGVCIRHIAGTLRRKRQARETGAPDTRRLWLTNTWETAVLCMLAIAFCGTSFLQHVSPYGVSRIRYSAYPYDAALSCALPDFPDSAQVYRYVQFDTNAIARQLAAAFRCDTIVTMRNYKMPDETAVIIRNISNPRTSTIEYQYDDVWNLPDTEMRQSDGFSAARQVLEPLLQEGETLHLENADLHQEAGFIRALRFWVESSDVNVYNKYHVNGRVYFKGGRIVELIIELDRMTAMETTKLVSVARIFQSGRLPFAQSYDCTGYSFIVNKIEMSEIYCEAKGILVPCYIFSGTYGFSSDADWTVMIDAVDRGILPYVVPGAIAMAAIGVSIRKRRKTKR